MTMQRKVLVKITSNLVIWTLIFNITEAFNATVRHGRSSDDDDDLDPNILYVKFYHKGQIQLTVLKEVTDTTLASEMLQMRHIQNNFTVSDEYKLFGNFLDAPIFYHGDSFSALTYFPRTRTLHGVLDQKFSVKNLPLVSADDPDEASAFIHEISDGLSGFMVPECLLESPRHDRVKRMVNKRKHDDDSGCPPEKKRKIVVPKKILYPEIFLIIDVTADMIDSDNSNKFEKAIMYVLSYWNTVDMLFRTVKNVDIRINIAGILIGQSEDISEAVVTKDHILLHKGKQFFWSSRTLDDLGSYFFHNDMIKRDSYDFLVWMTSNTLIDDDVYHGTNNELRNICKEYIAVAEPGDCGGMHEKERRDRKRSNRAIVMYDNDYSQFHVAAQGLAKLMFVVTDDFEIKEGQHHSHCLPTNRMTHSSGIMDPLNQKFEGYLLWSFCSEVYIDRYSRTPSSCCLLNYPSRTMGVPESPKRLSITQQCKCYGMRRYPKRFYARDICDRNLVCKNVDGVPTRVGKPLDGSPCTPKGKRRVSFCNHNDCL